MNMPELDPNTPHGHTAKNARLEGRVIVSVTMRPNQMSQMLPDGRGYSGAGPHEIQIYASDLKNLQALVEPEPGEVVQAHVRFARKMAAWCAEDRNRVPEAYPGSVSQAFREEMLRDMLPVVSFAPVAELGSIAMDELRARAAAGAEAAANQAQAGGAGGLTATDVQRMIGDAVGKAISAERERVAATAKAGK